MKNFLKSKTMWANVAMALIYLFGGSVGVPPAIVELVSVPAVVAINSALRFMTKDKLTIKGLKVNVNLMLVIGLMLVTATFSACSLSADGVSYDDGKTKSTIEHIEGDIEK